MSRHLEMFSGGGGGTQWITQKRRVRKYAPVPPLVTVTVLHFYPFSATLQLANMTIFKKFLWPEFIKIKNKSLADVTLMVLHQSNSLK